MTYEETKRQLIKDYESVMLNKEDELYIIKQLCKVLEINEFEDVEIIRTIYKTIIDYNIVFEEIVRSLMIYRDFFSVKTLSFVLGFIELLGFSSNLGLKINGSKRDRIYGEWLMEDLMR